LNYSLTLDALLTIFGIIFGNGVDMKLKFVYLFVACAFLFAGFRVAAQSQKLADKQLNQEIFNLVNDYRNSIGLQSLKWVDIIAKESEKHSRNMASKQVTFGHDGFDGRSDRIMKQIKRANASAENVAYTSSNDAKNVVEMWLNSKGHKKNIEGNYNLTGIGVAKDKNGVYYFTQIFINEN
jgi:uncharacterized protein YkwD